MSDLPFDVIWDPEGAIFFAWNWDSGDQDELNVDSVHLFGIPTAGPSGMEPIDGSRSGKRKSSSAKYLTSVFRDGAREGILLINPQKEVFEKLELVIVEAGGIFRTLQCSYGGRRLSGFEGARIQAQRMSTLHLGLQSYSNEPDRVFPLVRLQTGATRAEDVVPDYVAQEISNLEPEHRYALAFDSAHEKVGESGLVRKSSAFDLIHPASSVELRFVLRQDNSEARDTGNRDPLEPSIVSQYKNYRPDRLKMSIRFNEKDLVQDWPNKIALFAKLNSMAWMRTAIRGQSGGIQMVENLKSEFKRLFGEDEDFRSYSLDDKSNGEIQVISLRDAIDAGVARDPQAIEFESTGGYTFDLDWGKAVADLAPGDTFGFVVFGDLQVEFNWPPNRRHLLTREAEESSHLVVFRYLADGFEYIQQLDDKGTAEKVLRMSNQLPGSQEEYRYSSPEKLHSLAERMQVRSDKVQIGNNLAVLASMEDSGCTFIEPNPNELHYQSFPEVLSFLALIETADAKGKLFGKPVNLSSFRAHRHRSSMDHALAAFGLSTDLAHFAGSSADDQDALTQILSRVEMTSVQIDRFRKMQPMDQALFLSLLGDPETHNLLVASRVLPDPDSGFDTSHYLSLCRSMDERPSDEDLQKALSWALDKHSDEKLRKLASDLTESGSSLSGWLTVSEMEGLGKLHAARVAWLGDALRPLEAFDEEGSTSTRPDDAISNEDRARSLIERLRGSGDVPDEDYETLLSDCIKYDDPDLWNGTIQRLEASFVARELPQQIESLVTGLVKWADADDVLTAQSHGEELNNHQLIRSFANKTPELVSSDPSEWFKASTKFKRVSAAIMEAVSEIYQGGNARFAGQPLPEVEEVIRFAQVMMCHRFSTECDRKLSNVSKHAAELVLRGIEPRLIRKRLVVLSWIRDGVPFSLGKLERYLGRVEKEFSALSEKVGLEWQEPPVPIELDVNALLKTIIAKQPKTTGRKRARKVTKKTGSTGGRNNG